MSTTTSRGRVPRPSARVSADLAQNKCAFTFANGHRCRMPRQSGHPYLCTFHARKEAQALAANDVGEEVASYLSGSYVSACDLTSALGRLFVAVAQGHIKPKAAAALACISQTLVRALALAQHEYINAFGTNAWRNTVRSSFAPSLTPEPPALRDNVPPKVCAPAPLPTSAPHEPVAPITGA